MEINHENKKPEPFDNPEQKRINRLQKNYQTGAAVISIERARYYTESFKKNENKSMSNSMRVATAMNHVYENMNSYLDKDDRIAGYWCEHFLGIPLDVERGVFNEVLKAELKKASMIKFRLSSIGKGLWYMIKNKKLGEFLKNQKIIKKAGNQPLNMDFKTMSERDINPYIIDESHRDELLDEILPYWNGKNLVDKLEKEIEASGLYSKDMHDFAVALPGNTSRQVIMLSTCATIASYQGHVILDFDTVMEIGLIGIKKNLKEKLKDSELSEEARDFLTTQLISVEGVISYCERVSESVQKLIENETDEERVVELNKMLAICKKVPINPPTSFREAIQTMWTIKTAVELAHPVNLHCFGRLDQNLYPYYKNDIENGVITKDEVFYLLQELLLKIMSQNIRPESNILSNFYHRFLGSSPVTIGGLGTDGEDKTNDLTYLIVKAAHHSRAITNVSIRVNKDTPNDLLKDVATYLKNGTSSYSLFNDYVNIEAMERRGFEKGDARDFAIMGCVEATCPGKTGNMSANALQLMRLLDITLRNGDSAILAGLIKKEGVKTGDPDQFSNFDQFLEALLYQAEFFIEKIVKGSNKRDEAFAKHLPAPLVSLFMDGCHDNLTDVTDGGATYDLAGISMINSIANLIDSLHVIKTLVYEKKLFTIKQLVESMDSNFERHPNVYKEIKNLPGKWGNGDPEVDALAHEVSKKLFELTYKYKTTRNGPFVVYLISMITHTIDGRLSIASPDGRLAAMPYAASGNPYNVEHNGATAALRSISALANEEVMGCAINMKFHPSAIGSSDESKSKWISMIRTYFDMGGSQLQPTCISAEHLKEAKKDPDKYRDLIIKVGGYSTYFVDLGNEIQDEIIARTEHVKH